MFKGEFKMGGRPESKAKGFYIRLWHHNKESDEYTTEVFKKSIENGEMGWSGVHEELLYRDENGKLWKAKFEVTDG